jgi:hypothetical protein
MSNTRLYKNGKEPSNPKSLTRRDIVRDASKFKTVEREHDPLRRFGGSIGGGYIDTDGDGLPDKIVRVTRGGSLGISKHPEIPASADPPVLGPSGLTAVAILPPAFGPSGLTATESVPASGPNGLTAGENVPSSGPSGLSASQQFNPPISGPSGLTATESAPAQGPSGLSASESIPASGPSGLTASEAVPVSGPSGLTATESIPASGPSGLTATESIPASGPSGLSATKLTLNIAPLSTDQDALVLTTPATGTIKYSSDSDRLFIYDGTDWHNFK